MTHNSSMPTEDSSVRDLFINQLKALPDHETRAVRENFLTASFIGVLGSSLPLRRRIVRCLVGSDRWNGEKVSQAKITARRPAGELVGTRFDPDRCHIDLELLINERSRIGVEIKLHASEGVDAMGRRQLDRYLRNKSFHGVAYLTPATADISITAWKQRDRRYLVPRDAHGTPLRRHFLWSDLYDAVDELASGRHAQPLIVALREFLKSLGIRPFHPLIGDLGGRLSYADAPTLMRRDRDRMSEAMTETQDTMESLGWECAPPRNNATFYTWPATLSDPIYQIWVSPGLLPGVVRIWVDFKKKRRSAAIDARFPDVVSESLKKEFGRDLFPVVRPVLENTKRRSIDVQIPYQALLAGLRTQDKIGERVAQAVCVVAKAASRVAKRYS